MGKERKRITLDLATLIASGIGTEYKGNSKERIRVKNFVVNFHHHIAKIRPSKHYTDSFLTDLCIAARICAMEEINEPRYPTYYFLGSRLEATIEDQLGIKSKKEIPAVKRMLALFKLYDYLIKNKIDLHDDDILKVVEKAIKNVYQEIDSVVNHIVEAIPTEAVLDDLLQRLVAAYTQAKQKDNAEINPEHEFLAQLGEAIEYISRTSPRIQEESAKFGFNRSWRLKVGTLIFFMEAVNAEYILRSPDGNSELFTICAEGMKRIKKIDPNVKKSCLERFKRFINDETNCDKIEEYGKLHYTESEKLADIDNSLEPYIKLLNKFVYANSGYDSSFPTMTVTMGVIGAILLASTGAGLGAAAGNAIAQMDIMVPFLTSMSQVTRAVMLKTVGPSGRNMAYKCSELVTSCTLSHGLSTVCEATAMAIGGSAGAAVGLSIDLTADSVASLREHLELHPTVVEDEQIELAMALIKYNKLLTPEKVHKIKRNIGLFDKTQAVSETTKEKAAYMNDHTTEADLPAGYNI